MTHRSFDVARVDRDPVTFDLAGQSFTCRPTLAAGALLNLGAATDDRIGARSSRALIGFMTSALIEEDVPRFLALIEDPDVAIPIDTLGEVVEWLAEELVGFPTLPPSGSPGGRSTNGRTSMVGAPSPASTPNGSQRTGS